ncbi:MAG: IS200/IS605 family transposase [Anaerolineales bacterium]|jgi:putative transposase|nr:IS200/IS605 family transposase [Anaerolineales bacterium]
MVSALSPSPYRQDETRLFTIRYHLVWLTKRGQDVLTAEVARTCRREILSLCETRAWTVVDLVIQPHYVHLHVEVFPSTSAEEIVKACKEASAGALRQGHAAQLKRLPAVWTRAYFASTEPELGAEAIQLFVDRFGRR